MFKDKTLLITGGTGSFGNAVLERFSRTELKEIRIFSRDEKKQDDMRLQGNDEKVKYYIGDVRNLRSITDAMKGVDYVFHAAALKQVPSCEFYPLEAVRTNVLGAENVFDAAIASGVKRVVALSTDKAVYPINAMGLTKALMEKVLISKSRNSDQTAMMLTRYGNVMASRGSVIPLFVQQIKSKAALTITDPNMTRFLMSLDDSVDLVIHAFTHGHTGDIFVQKAPASTVLDLAHALIKIFDSKSQVRVIGTRHGEKLYESLVSREEMAKSVEENRYYRIPADNRDLNYTKYVSQGEHRLSESSDYTSHNTERLNIPAIMELLLKLPYIQKNLYA